MTLFLLIFCFAFTVLYIYFAIKKIEREEMELESWFNSELEKISNLPYDDFKKEEIKLFHSYILKRSQLHF